MSNATQNKSVTLSPKMSALKNLKTTAGSSISIKNNSTPQEELDILATLEKMERDGNAEFMEMLKTHREERNWEGEIAKLYKESNMFPVAFADEIVSFLLPFLNEIGKFVVPLGFGVEVVIKKLDDYVKLHDVEKKKLMDAMKVKSIMFPYLCLNLSTSEIQYFNNLESDDPQTVSLILENEEYRVLSTIVDFYDKKEVIGFFVKSNVDSVVTFMPSLGLNPYPLCQYCKDKYGEKACSVCGITRYCSKDCQIKDWNREPAVMSHKILCGFLRSWRERGKCITFEYENVQK